MNLPVSYKEHYIQSTDTARDALKRLDQLPTNEVRILLVLDNLKMLGTLTDGDIRRGLLAGREISESVTVYMNTEFKSLRKREICPELLRKYRDDEIWFLPVLNAAGEVEDVINLKYQRTLIPAAALLMAGGRGERLRPLTDSIPKPLLKIGKKPILEINIDRLKQFGIKKFYISVQYLGDMIIDYFGDGSEKGISIHYIREDQPLGTLGACSKIVELEYENLIVMNADILTNIDFEDFFEFFLSKQALMCAATIPYSVNIPYGIMKLTDDDQVAGIVEKPTYTYYANAGIYFLKRESLVRIPSKFYNATDLMEELIREEGKLVHFPILQYWLDIGKYEDYIRAQQDFSYLNFI